MGEGCGCCCGHGSDAPECESCGMPMESAELHGGADETCEYCKFCCNDEGKLKSKEDVRKGMIEFYIEQGKSHEEAEKYVDEYMKKMPAWQNE